VGNVTISTSETEIYYPSDWLVEGGPPFEVMNCPINDANNSWDDEDALMLVRRDTSDKPWRVVQKGMVLMETSNHADAMMYMLSYMVKYELWKAEQE
jgi:hypothetical protein